MLGSLERYQYRVSAAASVKKSRAVPVAIVMMCGRKGLPQAADKVRC